MPMQLPSASVLVCIKYAIGVFKSDGHLVIMIWKFDHLQFCDKKYNQLISETALTVDHPSQEPPAEQLDVTPKFHSQLRTMECDHD